MRVLLVEDDTMLGEAIRTGLHAAGLTIDWVQDGEAAVTAATAVDYELVVLDLGLPRRDGLSVLRHLRHDQHDTPVLIISAQDEVDRRIEALESGADDFLVKPMVLQELVTRCRVLLRRAHGRSAPVIVRGWVEIDPGSRTVKSKGNPVSLSRREYSLLLDLAEHQGIARTKAQLEDNLYGFGDEIESNTVEVHVHHLRKKLGDNLIHTIRGVGYVLSVPADEAEG